MFTSTRDKLTRLIGLGVLLIAFAGSASAATPGGYLGFSLGQADDDVFNETDTGYKLVGGYTIQNFGMEIAFVDLGTYINGIVDEYGVAFDGILYLPLGQNFDLFGKFGLFSWVFDVGFATDDGTDLTYGFGGNLRMSDQLSLRAEWERFTEISGGDVDLLSAGITYHFY